MDPCHNCSQDEDLLDDGDDYAEGESTCMCPDCVKNGPQVIMKRVFPSSFCSVQAVCTLSALLRCYTLLENDRKLEIVPQCYRCMKQKPGICKSSGCLPASCSSKTKSKSIGQCLTATIFPAQDDGYLSDLEGDSDLDDVGDDLLDPLDSLPPAGGCPHNANGLQCSGKCMASRTSYQISLLKLKCLVGNLSPCA